MTTTTTRSNMQAMRLSDDGRLTAEWFTDGVIAVMWDGVDVAHIDVNDDDMLAVTAIKRPDVSAQLATGEEA